MNVKQEYFENDTTVIKHETVFVAPTETMKEAVDVFENQQAHLMSRAEVKMEPQRSLGEVMLNSINDVWETQNIEIKASDLFVSPGDLDLIKQEDTKIEYIIPKAEQITDECDLPILKSEGEFLDKPSTSNWNTLKESKYNGLKKKDKCYKSFPNHQKRLLKKYFRKLWLACEFCGYFYTDNFEYFTHYFNHSVKMNTSDLLNFKTKNTSLKMYKHRNKHIKTFNMGNKKTKQFEKKSIIMKHVNDRLKMNTDKKPFQCEICFKQFIQQGNLNNHLKIHIGEKPFKCELCLKQFKLKQHLKIHLKIHDDEKPFKCEICLKQFVQMKDLNVHSRIHTGVKPFKCEICFKQFIQKGDLNKHLKIHTGIKPFKCEICFKQFIEKGDLNVHLKIHTGEKPFKCIICSRQFKLKHHLQVHLRFHTGEKPFKCEICLKEFKKQASVKHHLKVHINETAFEF